MATGVATEIVAIGDDIATGTVSTAVARDDAVLKDGCAGVDSAAVGVCRISANRTVTDLSAAGDSSTGAICNAISGAVSSVAIHSAVYEREPACVTDAAADRAA